MTKVGTPYEQVVAEVLASFDPKVNVSQGQWVPGPDGRRDMDVLLEGTVNGKNRRVMVECKDFNPDPKSTGPVGIQYVDALDSKRRDLAVDFAVICSNGGFTADAIHKAKRVGIGIISVLKKNDERVRFRVVEEIYLRHLKLENSAVQLKYGEFRVNVRNTPMVNLKYRGLSIEGWVAGRIIDILASQPIVTGHYQDALRFRQRIRIDLPWSSVEVTELTILFTISGTWLASVGMIDATRGIYDWIRRRVRVPTDTKYSVDYSFNFDIGTPITEPPPSEFIKDGLNGEIAARFMRVENLSRPPGAYPNLTPLILPEDLSLEIRDCAAK